MQKKSTLILLISLIFLQSFEIKANPSVELNYSNKTEIQSVIKKQIFAFQKENYKKAFSYASPNIQNTFKNSENFIKMVKKGYSPLLNLKNFRFGKLIYLKNTKIQEVILFTKNNQLFKAYYQMIKIHDNSWKIDGGLIRSSNDPTI